MSRQWKENRKQCLTSARRSPDLFQNWRPRGRQFFGGFQGQLRATFERGRNYLNRQKKFIRVLKHYIIRCY